jgi:HSP20 family molecular chaperone IbpA
MYNPLKFYAGEAMKTINDRAKEVLSFLYPAVTISEDAGEIIVEADMPGFDKKDVKVRLDRNAIVIQGSRKMEQKGTMILNQRPENLFKRVSLPYDVDPAAELTAKYTNGVLTVRIPVKGIKTVKVD